MDPLPSSAPRSLAPPPTKFELVINLTTAKALALDVPDNPVFGQMPCTLQCALHKLLGRTGIEENGCFVALTHISDAGWFDLRHPTKRSPNGNAKLVAAHVRIAVTLIATPPRIVLDGARAQAAAADTYRQLSLFGDVFERVRADYVEKPDDSKLIESAINGMLGRAREKRS
jgi:hypothetical protein